MFNGKVEAMDATARTLTVDGKVIYTADSTKITKAGKAIKLAEVVVGDEVHGPRSKPSTAKPKRSP